LIVCEIAAAVSFDILEIVKEKEIGNPWTKNVGTRDKNNTGCECDLEQWMRGFVKFVIQSERHFHAIAVTTTSSLF
jgi:CO dehydrogenase nickel-insertion accessory protein CooC1